MKQPENAAAEPRVSRRLELVLVIAGTTAVLGGLLYWTGTSLGMFQGSSFLRTASDKILSATTRRAPSPEVVPASGDEPRPESRIAAMEVVTAPLPKPASRQLTTLDPFRGAGQSVPVSLLSMAKPLAPAERRALEERSQVSKTALPDGRVHLSITMNPATAPTPAQAQPVPAPPSAKAPAKKTRSKPAASRPEAAGLTVALAGHDLNRRESERWISALTLACSAR